MMVVVKRLKQSCSLTELKEELNTYFPDSCPAYDLQEVGQKIKVANMQFLESVNVDEESLKEFLRTFPVSKIQAETLNLSSKLVESLESQLSAKEKQMVKGSNQIPDNVVNHMELVPNLAIHLKP
ncbi:uncharacterized protein LOC141902541 isoform X2 [Tubulanus polymorphus]|uniref:uncharacterized protein LOC141902541 isoform X2 n=1 Tax=Tubulanus polymorphus TaxID=672921 RepID=UPI003DA3C400